MSDWVRKTGVLSSRRQLQIKQKNGKQEGLYVITRTEYEQNSKTGEIRPVQQDNVKTVTVFTEIPNGAKTVDGKDLWTEAKAAGTEYWYQDANAKRYVAQFGLNTVRTSRAGAAPTISNQTFTTQFAGAALRNDVANWKNGKTADFTDNAFALANQSAIITAADDADVVVTNLSGNLGIARSQNNATLQPTNGGGGGGDDPPDTSPVITGASSGIGTVRIKDEDLFFPTGKNGNTLRYPSSIIEDSTDYLLISIAKYERPSTGLVRGYSDSSVKSKEGKKSGIGNIILPIPSNIQDGNSVSYADGTLDGITAAAVKGAYSVMTTEAKSTDQLLKEGGEKAKQAIQDMADSDLKGQILRSLAVQAASLIPGTGSITPDQLLARQTGGILNPNMELLFNGVALRSFRFSFKMTPRNKDEAASIKSIIRTLKVNMAPQTLTNDSFLRTPNVFDLQYMKGNGPHPFLHRFKTCALTDMSVNYTGEGLYASYSDATPVSMVMDLTFKELEPIYDTDYKPVGGVGY